MSAPFTSSLRTAKGSDTDGAGGERAHNPPTASAIYEGTVRHRRFQERAHEFQYRLALAYIDLEELPALLGGRLVSPRPGLARFRRRDYLGEERVPLARAVGDLVAERTGTRPNGPIRLLANLSAFGHCFNPVSFYYCMDESDERMEAAVAEVTNTPWGERHAYVLAPARSERISDSHRSVEHRFPAVMRDGRLLEGSFAKALHVSPFMGMNHRYRWRMTMPGETLSVHIANSSEGQPVFDATLSLRRRELTRASMTQMTARYPASALRVLALIYLQAARLKLKGVSVHPRQRGRLT